MSTAKTEFLNFLFTGNVAIFYYNLREASLDSLLRYAKLL